MKDTRSASQILFGFLPEQTVDVKGGVWKVDNWATRPVSDVDQDELRRALFRLAAPWTAAGLDGGLADDLHKGAEVRVESLDRDRGVWLKSFPRVWMCKNKACRRLHDTADAKCPCGTKSKGQLPFVGYHDACGAIREPWFPRCPQHNEVRITFPGTATASEIKFECPVCARLLRQGFGFANCNCGGGQLRYNVHRAASVYVPRGVVIVNPPSKTQMRKLQAAGGAATALAWMVGGAKQRWVDGVSGGEAAGYRSKWAAEGKTPEQIEAALRALGLDTGAAGAQLTASADVVGVAQAEASSIALALAKSRMTLADLEKTAPASSPIGVRYRADYPAAFDLAKLQFVDLVERFPILTGQVGYTRGDTNPGATRLRAFRDKDGAYTIYGDLASTEALLVRLRPSAVASWIAARGHPIPGELGDEAAARRIAELMLPPEAGGPNAAYSDVVTLVHSYAHRFIRLAAYYAGIDRNGLSELLFPMHLCFFAYAVPRGDFVLGGLQALFENDLDTLVRRTVTDEHRCALDPGCSHSPSGASCAVCMHLGEPSCRMFNTALDRAVLFSEQGYLRP